MSSNIPLDYARARCEHALMLRLEGLKMSEIGERFGVTPFRASQLVIGGKESFARSLKRSRLNLVVELMGDTNASK